MADQLKKIGDELPRSRPRFEDVQRDQDLFERFNRRRTQILASLGREPSPEECVQAVNQAFLDIYGNPTSELVYEIDRTQ